MADDQGRPTLMEEFQQIKAIRNTLMCSVPEASKLWRAGVRMETLTEGRQTPEPRTWEIPPEPGPEVTAVRTPTGTLMRRTPLGSWQIPGQLLTYAWSGALCLGPLTDATGDDDGA